VYQTEAGIVLCPASRPAKTPLTPVYIGCLSSIVESPHEYFYSVFPLTAEVCVDRINQSGMERNLLRVVASGWSDEAIGSRLKPF
jgi:hypothetical protein